MKPTPRISILMPVYNNGNYVAEAIESMLGQTFADFELIVLDDCSTDHSRQVIESFNDKRIVYHRNETNLGLANNLNVGLDLAKGELIARMDGDDISLPERLRVQVEFLDKNPDIDLCSCALEKFGTETDVWIREANPEQIKVTMLFFSPVLHATSVWRRAAFEKHNLQYRQEAFPAEDYDLWARAVFYCRLANIPEVMYRYRIHGVQVTKTDDRASIRDRQIRAVYLQKALPCIAQSTITEFLDRCNSFADPNASYAVFQKIVKANKENRFFDTQLLKIRFSKTILDLISKYIEINDLSTLDFRLICKYKLYMIKRKTIAFSRLLKAKIKGK